MWKQWLKDYFSFTKKERNAVLLLTVLVVLAAVAPVLIPKRNFDGPDPADIAAFERQMLALRSRDSTKRGYREDYTHNSPKQFDRQRQPMPAPELFYFDPNTLDPAGWAKLGIREKTVKTIHNYLAKGGKFRAAVDLSRVYGLREDEFRRLEPYIRLPERPSPVPAKPIPPDRPVVERRLFLKKMPAVVDINRSDSAAWEALPGIGEKLAARIISFRERLGGFAFIEQVGETFGLTDSVFQQLRPLLVVSSYPLRKLKINTATPEELRSHPYIKWKLANVIVQFRQQHGRFSQSADLLKLNLVTQELLHKLEPYLDFD